MNIEQAFIDKAIHIVKQAGGILLQAMDKEHNYVDKPDGSFATEADLASEEFLKAKLSELLPEACFIAEESGESGSGRYCWVIDPLDGTTNFSKGFTYFAVNVALTYDEEPILAFTYNPSNDEMFFAQKGKGAFLNGQNIKVSDQKDHGKAVCSLAVPCRKKDCEEFYTITKTLQDNVSTVRKFGSASLDMAGVACGRLDGAILKYVSWWDIAAGILLITEAGGSISEFSGSNVSRKFSTCLGANSFLHANFVKFLSTMRLS